MRWAYGKGLFGENYLVAELHIYAASTRLKTLKPETGFPAVVDEQLKETRSHAHANPGDWVNHRVDEAFSTMEKFQFKLATSR